MIVFLPAVSSQYITLFRDATSLGHLLSQHSSRKSNSFQLQNIQQLNNPDLVEFDNSASTLLTDFILNVELLLDVYGPGSENMGSYTLDPVERVEVLELIICLPPSFGFEDPVWRCFSSQHDTNTKEELERVVTNTITIIEERLGVLDRALATSAGDVAKIEQIESGKLAGEVVKERIERLREGGLLARYAA